MKKNLLVFLSFVLLLLAGPLARAGSSGGKQVVELFTSQSCSSCPPAERLLGRLIASRADVIGLEFHVDYWNDLDSGSAGNWVDPFSDKRYTERQRRYESRGLEGENGLYTPQAVINGRTAVVGSDQGALDRLLAEPAPMGVNVAFSRAAGEMRVVVSGKAAGSAEVWLYEFDPRAVTPVGGGENDGRTLTNHNVVRAMRELGRWNGGAKTFVVNHLDPGSNGRGCAVVVQRPIQGPIIGADLCPS